MTEDHLRDLLKSAMPPSTADEPSRDLWPQVLRHGHRWPAWAWVDLGLAAAATLAALSMPSTWFLLACHF
jgi:hypothetical protein